MKREAQFPKEWELIQCLFGEHLLSQYPNQSVVLVQSEKTAVICTGFLSEYVWLATVGGNSLGDKLDILSGRKVTAYPDIDADDYWCECLSTYPNISISDCFLRLAGENLSYGQKDLSDLILEDKQQCTKQNFTQSATFVISQGVTTLRNFQQDYGFVYKMALVNLGLEV